MVSRSGDLTGFVCCIGIVGKSKWFLWEFGNKPFAIIEGEQVLGQKQTDSCEPDPVAIVDVHMALGFSGQLPGSHTALDRVYLMADR